MNEFELRTKAREITDEVAKATTAYDQNRLQKNRYEGIVNRAYKESQAIQQQLDALRSSNQIMANQENAFRNDLAPSMFGQNAGSLWGSPGPVRCNPLSPMDLNQDQLDMLWTAAQHKTPCSVEIKNKGRGGFMDAVKMKAPSPVLEGNIAGGFTGNLPPVQSPYAVGIGYEPTRIASLLPGAAMVGPSATWLSHTANAAEASGTNEGITKPDMGPTITENQVKPQKIAVVTELSLEAWQDTSAYAEGSFSAWLPQELTRSLINAESNYLLNANAAGGPTGSAFNGILATSGTLTRAVGSDTNLDALNKSFNDLRVGPAFAYPDLLITNPTTWASLRRTKDSMGRYILDLMSGPLNLSSGGQQRIDRPADEPNVHSIVPQGSPALSGDLWGVPVAVTTQCPAGTAIVMSIAAGGGIFWQRLGLRIEFNMWTDTMWTTNTYGFRAEERIALSVPRPTGINVVTGLPVS